MPEINEPKIRKIMHDAEIQSVSIASGSNKDNIVPRHITTDGLNSNNKEEIDDPVYGVASLSKPVFTYLVLKLINNKDFKLSTKLNEMFPFEEFCKKFGFEWENSEANKARVKLFTPHMILSHQTGLPIGHNPSSGPLKFDFEPGQGFGYSSLHLMYLQECIEFKFRKSLEELAKKYVFDPIGMKHSSFYPSYELRLMSETTREPGKLYIQATKKKGLAYEVLTGDSDQPWRNTIPWEELPTDFPKNTSDIIHAKNTLLPTILFHANKTRDVVSNAANSLHTTATDYARFCIHWMQDPDQRVKDAFASKVSMRDDPWAVREHVFPEVLDHLSWGYGFGLETSDLGEHTAFHTGDMSEWRAGVQLDLDAKSVKVFFSKSSYANGHLLQDQIFDRSYALDYFFDKFKFARMVNELKEDWRENRSFGIRQESIEHSNKMISSTTGIFAAISTNPLEAARNQSQSTQETSNQNSPEKPKIVSTEQQSSVTNRQEEDSKNDKSPNPFSTKFVPPGTIK